MNTTVEWTAWNHPRLSERGVETVYHHPLVLMRTRGNPKIHAVRPAYAPIYFDIRTAQWIPMPWASQGRRHWRTYGTLSRASCFSGEDEHLFHTINAVCEQLFEGGCLSETGRHAWSDQLEARVAQCASWGMAYRHLIIPEHHAVYADKLPGAPDLSQDRPLMRVLGSLRQQVREAVIYPLEVMRHGRIKHETSLPHDVHFTPYGSYLCYREIMRTLPECAPDRTVEESELIRREMLVAGDVARAMGLDGRKVEWYAPPKVKFRTLLKGQSFKPNQVDVFETENGNLPRLVIFRTSNSTHLFPYLLRHFSRVTAVASTRVFYDLVESEAPDVVLAEMPERYIAGHAPVFSDGHDLTSLQKDLVGKGFQETTGVALPLPRTKSTTDG